MWLSNEADRDKPFRLLLLVQSHTGYLRLCDLLTRAYRTNQSRGRPEIRREWFNETGTEGLIALNGAHHGDIGQALIADNSEAAAKLAQAWAALFPQRFYVEIQRPGPNAMTAGAAVVPVEVCVQRSLKLAAQVKLPVVATHPVQFLRAEDFRAHEARVCISEGQMLSDQRRPKLFTDQQYFLKQEEIVNLFNDLPDSLANSLEIAKRCNLKLELGKSRLPDFPTPNNESLDEYLNLRSFEGLRARMLVLYPNAEAREKELPRYAERL